MRSLVSVEPPMVKPSIKKSVDLTKIKKNNLHKSEIITKFVVSKLKQIKY